MIIRLFEDRWTLLITKVHICMMYDTHLIHNYTHSTMCKLSLDILLQQFISYPSWTTICDLIKLYTLYLKCFFFLNRLEGQLSVWHIWGWHYWNPVQSPQNLALGVLGGCQCHGPHRVGHSAAVLSTVSGKLTNFRYWLQMKQVWQIW